MDETRIKALLREADRMAGPPPAGPDDLADRVRAFRMRRRRRVVTTGGAMAAVVAVSIGAGLIVVARPGASGKKEPPTRVVERSTTAPDGQSELADLRTEIAALRAEAQEALALARRVAALREREERLAEVRRTLAGEDAREEARRQMEKAAFTMVYQADRMYRELNLSDAALRSYRQAIALFPDTRSAKIARQRLIEIEGSKGDQL